jgi:L-glyceraldehyde 3-phosphate reductase
MWPGPYGDRGSRKYLLASLDQSLKRLGLEYVDIYYHHRPDHQTPLEETMAALDQAARSGKALYTGISNYGGALTSEAVRVCDRQGLYRPVIHQPNYNMLNRGVETDLLPAVETVGMGVIAFCPLAQGLLTGKYLQSVPDDSRAKQPTGFLKEDRITPKLQAKLGQLHDIARDRSQSLAQLALQWTLRDPRVTTALIGASRPEQVRENAKLFEAGPLDEPQLQQIEKVLAA